jgi:hypothetical protein
MRAIMTRLGDEILVAYDDNELSHEQATAVELVLADDPVTKQRLELLQQAHGVIVSTFDTILAAETSTVFDITNITADTTSQNRLSNGTATEDNHTQVYADQEHHYIQNGNENGAVSHFFIEHNLKSIARGILWIAGTFTVVYASIIWGYNMQASPVPRDADKPPITTAPPASTQTANSWSYSKIAREEFISRKSLLAAANDASRDLISFQASKLLRVALVVPDFSHDDIAFRQARILNINDREFIQLAYLPNEGAPLFIYATTSEETAPISKAISAGVNLVMWSENGVSYAVAGKIEHWKLVSLAIKTKQQQ